MNKRRIIGDILILIAAVFTVYLCIIMTRRIRSVVLRDDYMEIFRYELVICALFLFFAFDVRFAFLTRTRSGLLKAVGWILRFTIIFAVALLLFFIGKISVGGFIHDDTPAQNAIVLGLALEDGRPAPDLLARLDTAERYIRSAPESKLILTGGNPDASGKTEAAVMREVLITRGVAEDRMLLEDQADSTKANFRNTARLIDPDDPVVLITSNYHMDRAVQTAADAGFTKIIRRPAPSSLLNYGSNVLYEVVLELNELTVRH